LQLNTVLFSQCEADIVNQFQFAKLRYVKEQYGNAQQRLLRLLEIIAEKEFDRKDIVGMCYLLLGAIYEKDNKLEAAQESYRKTIDVYGITLVDGVDLEALPIYRKIVKGEGQVPPGYETDKGTIEKVGHKKKGKKKVSLAPGGRWCSSGCHYCIYTFKEEEKIYFIRHSW
jgi:tetratricopeptide (TPR) repeat protein